jgi:SAM-dependent methyltransferase
MAVSIFRVLAVFFAALLGSTASFLWSWRKRPKKRTERKGQPGTLPIPPLELRRLVGPTDLAAFDNPTGKLVFGDLAYGPLAPGAAYQHIFDFGCGCGRNARQFLLQRQPPHRYVGVDISAPMIEWCQQNLDLPGVDVRFYHHDVWSPNPGYGSTESKNRMLPLREYGTGFTLINAFSVFTHLLESQTRFYLQELHHMLAEEGLVHSTWFLFNRGWFPILGPEQHCLYVNDVDPTQAVYYDWEFLRALFREIGFKIVDVAWAEVHGHQNMILLAKGGDFRDRADELEPAGTILGYGASRPPSGPEAGQGGGGWIENAVFGFA